METVLQPIQRLTDGRRAAGGDALPLCQPRGASVELLHQRVDAVDGSLGRARLRRRTLPAPRPLVLRHQLPGSNQPGPDRPAQSRAHGVALARAEEYRHALAQLALGAAETSARVLACPGRAAILAAGVGILALRGLRALAPAFGTAAVAVGAVAVVAPLGRILVPSPQRVPSTATASSPGLAT